MPFSVLLLNTQVPEAFSETFDHLQMLSIVGGYHIDPSSMLSDSTRACHAHVGAARRERQEGVAGGHISPNPGPQILEAVPPGISIVTA